VYLLGVVLLEADRRLPGQVRERLLVAYYRYSGEAGPGSHFDIVCDLLRPTGYTSQAKRPTNYPESLFGRVPLQSVLVTKLVGRLRTEDLYTVLPHYPEPRERSTALATQAAMLYVLLYFQPDLLKTEKPLMREIVDKYFCDNWVISVYMGSLVWLPEAWEPYRAARDALANTTGSAEVKRLALETGTRARGLAPRLAQLLTEGAVTQDSLLESVPAILAVVRESNVCLRWLLLHTAPLPPAAAQHKRTRQLGEVAREAAGFGQDQLFDLLLQVLLLQLLLLLV
jgi:WASH complex subunit strumpellin